MDPIRVLIVDDAVVIRRLLAQVVEEDPDLELAGVAANGRLALAKLEQVAVDIVTLDVEMPELDGIGTLREIRARRPDLPVVMFSTLTATGASTTLDALSLGASDYVTKPANVGSVTTALERVREELVPKLKALCDRTPDGGCRWPAERPVPPPVAARRSLSTGRIDVVAVGSSTGGPVALTDVLPGLLGDLDVPVVVTQHMPPIFTTYLAKRLDEASALTVCEAVDGQRVERGHVYIAPGDHHLTFRRRGTQVEVVLSQAPPENSCRPAVDVMLRSAVSVWGGNVLAVVLTGMGYDGMLGAEGVREAGGTVWAQDQATSVVWGMPGAVCAKGLADEVIALQHVAPRINARVRSGAHLTSARARIDA